jgi:hypothetical protein
MSSIGRARRRRRSGVAGLAAGFDHHLVKPVNTVEPASEDAGAQFLHHQPGRVFLQRPRYRKFNIYNDLAGTAVM